MEEQKIKSLQENQVKLDKLREELFKRQEEFGVENKDLTDRIDVYHNVEEEIKTDLRIDAEKEFKETGNKKLLGGIGIRILTKLIYSEDIAMSWAEENMPIAVKKVLDKKQFEAFAKTNDLDCVEKEEKVSVTFPKEIII